jgi:hypothetical protein
VPIVLEN